jgi:hypothetical protein
MTSYEESKDVPESGPYYYRIHRNAIAINVGTGVLLEGPLKNIYKAQAQNGKTEYPYARLESNRVQEVFTEDQILKLHFKL